MRWNFKSKPDQNQVYSYKRTTVELIASLSTTQFITDTRSQKLFFDPVSDLRPFLMKDMDNGSEFE
jgi:hypothetical protein